MANKATYPRDHQAGIAVPKGGSSCSNCEYLGEDKKTCTNKYFIKWNGSKFIPGEIDSYCSDWYHPGKSEGNQDVRDVKFEDVGL